MKRPPASSANASARMKQQRGRDTSPEITVRRLVSSLGHRYRIHSPSLPGSPDLSNKSRLWAIFVHGCYWHHHEGCPRATTPKANTAFWLGKFRVNRARDAAKEASLRQAGFQVIVVWECETREEYSLRQRLDDSLPVPR